MIISTDLTYSLEMLIVLLFAILIFITMIVWHEFGHMLWFKLVKKRDVLIFKNKLGFEIGIEDDYNCLMKNEYKEMLMFGVFIGILPLIVAVLVSPTYYIVLLLFPYLIGSNSDLNNIFNY